MLFHTSLRIINDRMDAEEIVHDTFIKFLDFKGDLTPEQTEAWLRKTCTRASVDRLRMKSRQLNLWDGLKEEQKDLSESAAEEEDRVWRELYEREGKEGLIERVKKELSRLAEGHRVVFTLYHFEGYDYQEISQILNIKESTVRSQYLRGRNKLTEIVKQY